MKATILIVEDEEALALLLRYNLEAEGYRVETVMRGDEADVLLKERQGFPASSCAGGCAGGLRPSSFRSSC